MIGKIFVTAVEI